MRKFIKACMVTGVVFLVLGLGVTAASVAMGARTQLYELKNRVYEWQGWRSGHMDYDAAGNEAAQALLTEEGARSYEGVRKLHLDIDSGQIILSEYGAGDQIMVEYEDEENIDCEYDGEELSIKSSGFRGDLLWGERKVYIYVPRDYHFEQVEVELAAGEVRLETISADELELLVKAGGIGVDNGNVNHLKAECKAGGINYSGTVTGDIEAESKTGGIHLELMGSESDYDYELSCTIGMITIGDESFSGLSGEKTISNQSDRSMELQCRTGAIEIHFTN